MPPKPKVMTPVNCEKCGNPMILRDSKRGPFLGCSAFPKCRATKQVAKLTGDDLKTVEALIPRLKEGGDKAAEMVAKLTGNAPRRPRPSRADRHRHRLRRMRQADGHPQRPPREIPGLQRISQVQKHRRSSGQAGGGIGAEWEWARGVRACGDDCSAADVGRGRGLERARRAGIHLNASPATIGRCVNSKSNNLGADWG